MVFKAFVACSCLILADDVALRLLRLVDEGVDLSLFLWDRPFGPGQKVRRDFLQGARTRLKA